MSTKYEEELAFWKSRLVHDQGTFQNKHYERIMLGMAQESSQDFLRGRIVADFGCGPRGSLVWADGASLRIGIDVLADAYADAFTDNITSHNMIYLKSTEEVIPLRRRVLRSTHERKTTSALQPPGMLGQRVSITQEDVTSR
jgi:hypothetical protein